VFSFHVVGLIVQPLAASLGFGPSLQMDSGLLEHVLTILDTLIAGGMLVMVRSRISVALLVLLFSIFSECLVLVMSVISLLGFMLL
jgi:hypothetical protein